ncbi:hypothetical protein [Methyloglobulus sp.]|uniref:hypothetical protein n=1 Tax=Methyloglobulus sp. TaxID=2518622 RepID=UPI0032B85271
MWVLVPTDEILSFASPSHMDVANAENAGAVFSKKSMQRKGDPNAAYLLRFSHLCPVGIYRRLFLVPLPTCGIPAASLRVIPDKCSDMLCAA